MCRIDSSYILEPFDFYAIFTCAGNDINYSAISFRKNKSGSHSTTYSAVQGYSNFERIANRVASAHFSAEIYDAGFNYGSCN